MRTTFLLTQDLNPHCFSENPALSFVPEGGDTRTQCGANTLIMIVSLWFFSLLSPAKTWLLFNKARLLVPDCDRVTAVPVLPHARGPNTGVLFCFVFCFCISGTMHEISDALREVTLLDTLYSPPTIVGIHLEINWPRFQGFRRSNVDTFQIQQLSCQ